MGWFPRKEHVREGWIQPPAANTGTRATAPVTRPQRPLVGMTGARAGRGRSKVSTAVIPDAGHFTQEEQPERAWTAIADFALGGYLLARARCGNKFQDAGRRQVLFVDPHPEG
jgi:hypothetical protein